VQLYNTSEKEFKTFLNVSKYELDWGDGTIELLNTLAPSSVNRQYIADGFYTIKLTQYNPWGVNVVKKTVKIPHTGVTITNSKGTAFFSPMIGSWASTLVSYDFIFSGDAENTISKQTSDNYVGVPFKITGYTISRLEELRQYGKKSFSTDCIKKTENGVVNNCWAKITTNINTPMSYTGYTIDNVDYIDFDNSTTVYFFDSSGFTSDWMVQSGITKNEELLNVVDDPEIQSDIYIERGKNSAMERVERLGEIDTTGDLENYGYKFFKFSNQ
jgi:hypothetical protein